MTAPACDKQIVGHGFDGYTEAMDWIMEKYREKNKEAGSDRNLGCEPENR